jgi:hypothetical protein
MIFTLEINGNRLCFAYIQPFDPIYQHMNRLISDTELELLRFREQSSKNATFISIHSIIRGAVLILSGESGTHRTADYLLFDLLDCDMFLRGREMIERYSFLFFISNYGLTRDLVLPNNIPVLLLKYIAISQQFDQ